MLEESAKLLEVKLEVLIDFRLREDVQVITMLRGVER